MMKILRTMLPRKSAQKQRWASTGARRDVRRVRPELECLERRDVPTITYHGGALLPNVEAQAMFYGSDWASNPYFGQAVRLSGFLDNIVNSSYMDMLTKAGYGVGRGTVSPGDVYGATVDKTQFLQDAQIQAALQSEIARGYLQWPDANRLYVVFVEDNVAIQAGTSTSVSNFVGYHGAFQANLYYNGGSNGITAYFPYDIHYAVVAYPGGNIPLPAGNRSNNSWSWLSDFDTMTLTASHELAESVTDPNSGYKTLGWNDDGLTDGEVGDISNSQTVYLNGYAVQRISDQNDQAMTPMGATSVNPVNFVLTRDGNLYVSSSAGLTFALPNVTSISDQGVDNTGHAMVDLIDGNGTAWEYHEGGGLRILLSNAKQVKAGQGVSYVLLTNGTVSEYKDSGSWRYNFDSGVQSIDAGTDQYGVNMITEVRTIRYYHNGVFITLSSGSEYSDSTGRHFIASNVQSMSAGQQGFMDYVTTGGDAYWYSEATAFSSYLGSGVAAVTAGTDQNGNYMIDLLYSSGALWEWRQGSGWASLANSVAKIGKAHAGIVDLVYSWGTAWAHDPYGWHFLANYAYAAA
jgi:hypothetical protein